MLSKFAAALVATALIAGPAFAAGKLAPKAAPTTFGATIKTHPTEKAATWGKHKRKHARRHSTHVRAAAMNPVRHVRHSITAHRGHASAIKGKSIGKRHVAHAAKLHATRMGTN
jgi:hypothetical protein